MTDSDSANPVASEPDRPVGMGRIVHHVPAAAQGLPRVVEFRGVAKTYNVGEPNAFTAAD